MAELATYIGIEPRTIIANAAIPRGTRVSMNASGTCDAQDITAIGDYIALTDIAALLPGEACSAHGGGKVACIAAGVNAMGDPAFTAAAGRVSNVSTGAIAIGRFTQPASGAGVLVEVELGA